MSAPGTILILPCGPCRLQQAVSPHHVGVDEFVRTLDGAIDMAFRREVDDRVQVPAAQKFLDE